MNLYVCASFPFGFKDGMWDLIVLNPDHCLSIYFSCINICQVPRELLKTEAEGEASHYQRENRLVNTWFCVH